MTQTEIQCLYCGKVPTVVNAAFNVKELPEYAKTGQVKYHYDCPTCYKTNYFVRQEDKRDVYGLLQTFQKFNPELFQ